MKKWMRYIGVTFAVLIGIGIVGNLLGVEPAEKEVDTKSKEELTEATAEREAEEKAVLDAEKAKEEAEEKLAAEQKAAKAAEEKEILEAEKAKRVAEEKLAHEQKVAAKAEAERLKKLEETKVAAAKEEAKTTTKEGGESVKISRTEEIENIVTDIIESDLSNVRVTNVNINKNAAKDDGSYIVLPFLVWDGKNRAPKTRERLETYGDHLAAKLAVESDVGEITVFWEVPYHKENENIAKYMYERNGNGMAKVDNWLSPILR